MFIKAVPETQPLITGTRFRFINFITWNCCGAVPRKHQPLGQNFKLVQMWQIIYHFEAYGVYFYEKYFISNNIREFGFYMIL